MKKTLILCVITIVTFMISINALRSESYDDSFVLPFSSSTYLKTSDLYNLSPWELKVARNEIYAKHGRKFQSKDLSCYFNNRTWYSEDPNYSNSLLNQYEQKNAITILNYEKQIKSDKTYKDMGCNYGKMQAGQFYNDYIAEHPYFILNDSSKRSLTEADLQYLTPWQLKVARNEIYAKHGRAFKSADLRCYFETKGWYNVNPNYSDNLLNQFERKNAVTILNYEKKTRSGLTYKDMGCGYDE